MKNAVIDHDGWQHKAYQFLNFYWMTLFYGFQNVQNEFNMLSIFLLDVLEERAGNMGCYIRSCEVEVRGK